MAGPRLLAAAELAEMILLAADVDTILSARRAHPAFLHGINGSLALRRKLRLLPKNAPSQIWGYRQKQWVGNPTGVDDVAVLENENQSPDWMAIFSIKTFTIKTPNPVLLGRAHQPDYYADMLEEIVHQPKYNQLLISLGGAYARRAKPDPPHDLTMTSWEDKYQNVCLHSGIDRLDITTKFFPAYMDNDCIYYYMMLFEELTTTITILYQLNDVVGFDGRPWKAKLKVTNEQGVRMRDVVDALKQECRGLDVRGDWAVQVCVDGAIFPVEWEKEMIDKGEERLEWIQRAQ